MRDAISELLVPPEVVDKLGAHGISELEVEQVRARRSLLMRDARAPLGLDRRLLIGTTEGARALTLVVEPTADPTTWVVVTGWEAESHERKMLKSR
jgi:uncharacterized DUF497 family protein